MSDYSNATNAELLKEIEILDSMSPNEEVVSRNYQALREVNIRRKTALDLIIFEARNVCRYFEIYDDTPDAAIDHLADAIREMDSLIPPNVPPSPGGEAAPVHDLVGQTESRETFPEYLKGK